MTDYNNSGNDFNENEGLVGQRNENSVLFSLDSLASLDDKDSGNASSGFSFGGSGDASGLIDLNTLAAMGAGSSAPDELDGVRVFNTVASKRGRRRMFIVIAAILVALLALAGVGYYFVQKEIDKRNEIAAKLEEEKRVEAERTAKLQAELEEAQRKQQELEMERKRRVADQEAVRAQLEAQEANKTKEEEETAADDSDSKKPTRRASAKAAPSKASDTTSKKAPAGKGPSPNEVKSALQDSNGKAKKCAKNGNLVVSMTLTSKGNAKNVKGVSGSFKGTPTERCIITVIERHSFPTFSGKDVPVRYNYKL